FLLSERGQRVFMERGLFPITPKYKVQGAPGSPAEMAVEFTGGVRSYFERDVSNVYDEAVGQKRSDAPKQKFRTDIEASWERARRSGFTGSASASRAWWPSTARASRSAKASCSPCSGRRAAARRPCSG